MSSKNEKLRLLAESVAQQNQKDEQRRQELRSSYYEQALELQEKYQADLERWKPEARAAQAEVISPWWSELQSSGVVESLGRAVGDHFTPIRISDKLPFFWPDEALAQLKQGRDDSYSWVSLRETRLAGTGMPGVEHREKLRVRSWEAYVSLRAGKKGLSSVLHREIVGARGMAVGYLHSSLQLPFDISSMAENAEIHPQAVVGFAQQIENGEVEKRLFAFLTSLR